MFGMTSNPTLNILRTSAYVPAKWITHFLPVTLIEYSFSILLTFFFKCYCHSHQLSRLGITFPSIPLATHLHSLVNHAHLESLSGSSSPVTANQAPHKNMLTPHSHFLVSQLFCMAYLTHLSVYLPLSTPLIWSWFSSASPILCSRLAS